MIAIDSTGSAERTGIPERQMWCAVLDKVLEDLRNHLPDPPRALSPRWAGYEPQRRAWFFDHAKWQNKNRDTISARHFAFSNKSRKWRGAVCDYAGISEECFVKAARTRMPK